MDASSIQTANAVLTEHLQYTPLSLIDDIIDSVNNLIYQGIGSLETGLLAIPPERLGFKPENKTENDQRAVEEYSESRKEIEEGLHKLETLLNSKVDRNFDKFEIYVLRNILNVPEDLAKWIRLSHYEDMQHPLPRDAPTPESVDLLRQKLHASRNVSKALQREHRRNEAILTQLRQMTSPGISDGQTPNVSFLSEIMASQSFSGQSQQPLATTTKFTLSQLPALKAVVAELRSRLATIGNTPLTAGTAKHELREERRGYIEQRTQAVLDRGGQSFGEDINTSGRKIDPGNIQALEQVAGIFHPT